MIPSRARVAWFEDVYVVEPPSASRRSARSIHMHMHMEAETFGRTAIAAAGKVAKALGAARRLVMIGER